MNDIHIKHEDKYDNHVFEFSTALYELYKRETIDYYNNLNKNTQHSDIAVIEQGTDEPKIFR